MYVNPPPYIQADARSREQFLSEIGNITPPQREIFHTLCKLWQSEISYNWFLGQTSGLVKNPAAELERLMERLSQKACGLITRKFEEGGAAPDKIILTPPNDPRFFYYRVRQELDAFAADTARPLPTEKLLEDGGLSLTPAVTQTLETGELELVFGAPAEDEQALIFRVPLPEADALLLTGGSGTHFTNACLAKLRAALGGPKFLTELSRIRGSSIGELRGRLDSKDPIFWLGLTEDVRKLRRDPLRQKKLGSDEHEFKTAAALKVFIEYKIEDLRKKKLEQEERDKDYEAICLQLRARPEPLVSAAGMRELLGVLDKKYPDKAAEAKQAFLERYTESRDRVRLSTIVQLASSYIHQDNLYPFFLERFRVLSYALRDEYGRTLDLFLRRRRRERPAAFHNRQAFEDDMAGKIRALDSFIADVLERPRILAEALILHFKETRGVKDIREIRSELEKYFKPESMVYKNLSAVFGLSSAELFEQAFSRLSIWRQLWLRITGRYKSYRDQVFGGREKAQAAVGKSGPPAAVEQAPSADQIMKSGRRSDGGTAGGPPGARSGAARPAKPAPPAKPQPAYTKRDQERAWKNFGDTLRKK